MNKIPHDVKLAMQTLDRGEYSVPQENIDIKFQYSTDNKVTAVTEVSIFAVEQIDESFAVLRLRKRIKQVEKMVKNWITEDVEIRKKIENECGITDIVG